LPSEKRQKLGNIPAAHLYKFIGEFGIDSERLARYISNFLNLKYEDVLSKIRKDEFDSRPTWMFEQYQMKAPADRSKPLI
jgi:hypothetical protein